MRLSHYIQSTLAPHLSLKQIKKAIEENSCKVNGRRERFASYLVRQNDRVEFEQRKAQEIEILYEDQDLAVVHKPPFIVCEAKKGLLGYRLAHRLDKETSGCLLLAKTAEMEEALAELFRKREVEKEYLAVVKGRPRPSGVIDKPIGGQSAKTAYRLEKKGKNISLIRCFPETGRTHQIRIHLASIGHPILGETKYGRSDTVVSRILLHSAKIGFVHPRTHRWLSVEAPLPKEFYEAFNR